MKEESELREKERILFSIMQYMPLCCDEQNARNRSATNCTVTSSSFLTSSSSQSLITTYDHPKIIRLPDSYSKETKALVARWICKDMQPFAIVDYADFCEITQRCVSICSASFIEIPQVFSQ